MLREAVALRLKSAARIDEPTSAWVDRWRPIMIATVHLHTLTGEQLLTVEGHDFDPFVTLTVRDRSVHLTRDQARMAGDALRAIALTAIDEYFVRDDVDRADYS
jgi:hypothetical protein